jgi:hypothetical protein
MSGCELDFRLTASRSDSIVRDKFNRLENSRASNQILQSTLLILTADPSPGCKILVIAKNNERTAEVAVPELLSQQIITSADVRLH